MSHESAHHSKSLSQHNPLDKTQIRCSKSAAAGRLRSKRHLAPQAGSNAGSTRPKSVFEESGLHFFTTQQLRLLLAQSANWLGLVVATMAAVGPSPAKQPNAATKNWGLQLRHNPPRMKCPRFPWPVGAFRCEVSASSTAKVSCANRRPKKKQQCEGSQSFYMLV